MANTTNFGWETPDDTDLVKDGAAAMRTLGNSIDASFVDLKGGTSGQILSKNSNTDLDFVWIANDQGDITAVTAGTGLTGGGTAGAVTLTNDMATTITAAGDIVVGTGSGTYDNLPIGTTGQILTADTSVSPYKVKWATPAGGGKVLQVVSMSTSTNFSSTSTSYVDITNYNLSITPSSTSSKVLVIFSPSLYIGGVATQNYQGFEIMRGSTAIVTNDNANVQGAAALGGGYTWQYIQASFVYLDSPATTSSTTYKGRTKDALGVTHGINTSPNGASTITLLEIGA